MPRYRTVARRLPPALCSAALAGLLLSPLSGVATASGAGGPPDPPGWVVPGAFVSGPADPSAVLEAAYRAARAERSFELTYEVSLPVFGGSAPSKPLFYVLQTKQSSRAVEHYQFSLKGKLVTTYVFFSTEKTCTWFAPGQSPPGSPKSATVPSCSGFNSSGYNSEVFGFLALTRAHVVGPGDIAGTAVTGVAGNLVQSIVESGDHTTMSWGQVTFWAATKTSLPLAITASADGHKAVIFQYSDWDSPAVAFPPGTPF
ncbi:MAG: hypothetical protein ABSE77_16925 [Acidimicrobiales bacterium]|jgi:hypothetical protein